MRDKIERAKELARKYSYELTFAGGMAVGVGIVLVSLKSPEELLTSRYPFGTSYNPSHPIPSLLMSEEDIKREIATGILVAGFFNDNKKTKAKVIDYLVTKLDDFPNGLGDTDFQLLTKMPTRE